MSRKQESKECTVCVEKLNRSDHKPIECPYCHYEACRTCVQTYLMMEAVLDPMCMNPECQKGWSREFLNANVTKTFVNGPLKKRREQVLLDREKNLIPEAMPHLAQIVRRERIADELSQLQADKRQIERRIKEKKRELQAARLNVSVDELKDEAKETRFIRACPKDDCKGYLSTQWRCAICETWVCSHCLALKASRDDANHQCDPDDVKSATLIKSDSKPCPNCKAMIHRIEGCSTMWCSSCHKGFDWRTGRIIHGEVHNPHYYEYMRQHGGEVKEPGVDGYFPCGGMPYFGDVLRIVRDYKEIEVVEHVGEIHRIALHIFDVEIPRFRYKADANANNLDLRIKYLQNKISEDKWKEQLQRREKARLKYRNIQQILEMLSNSCIDVFQRLIRIPRGTQLQPNSDVYREAESRLNQLILELENLKDYANGAFYQVSKEFNCKIPMLSKTWSIEMK